MNINQMTYKINEDLHRSLNLLRNVLALILLIIATPIITLGYVGILPKNLGLEIFITFIGIYIGYFALDSLIEKYLSGCGFEFINKLIQSQL